MATMKRWLPTRRPTAPLGDVERLVVPLLPALYGSALNLTGNEHDAEDLLHDLVLKLFRQTQSLESIDVLLPWLRRMLYNLFVDRYRARQRSPLSMTLAHADEHAIDELVCEQSGPERLAEQADDQQRVRAALQRLSVAHRAVVVLHDIEGYSLVEITEVLDVPVGTVESRLFRARQHLLSLLSEGNQNATSSVTVHHEVIK